MKYSNNLHPRSPTRIPPEGPVASVSITGAALAVIPSMFTLSDTWLFSGGVYLTKNYHTVGQIPYQSRISGREEYLPVVATLVGQKACLKPRCYPESDSLTPLGGPRPNHSTRRLPGLGNGPDGYRGSYWKTNV